MSNRFWSSSYFLLLVCSFAMAGDSAIAQGNSPSDFIIPNEFSAQLPDGSVVLHDYDQAKLASIQPENLPRSLSPHVSELEDTGYLSYRVWNGAVAGHDPRQLPNLDDGYFLLALIGPLDPAWRSEVEASGLAVVDHVNPYGLLVRGGSEAVQVAAETIMTSREYPVITHALHLPDESRATAAISEWLSGRSAASDLGIRTFDNQTVVRIVFHSDVTFSQIHPDITEFLEPGPEFVPGGDAAQYLATQQTLSALLEEVPEVAFVHGVYPKELHNNIGPQEHITNIEPVWSDLEYTGSGLIAGVNDGGLDLEHPDFPPESVVATAGAMSGTDNGHGTHVTGTVAGRGATPSPENISGCGDVTPPLPDARGMAWEAQVTHNNLFDGGVEDETSMMEWQAEQGAVINNNSWGYSSIFGPVTTYDSESVAVDAAVRDAIPGSTDINDQLSIVFSAGNSADAGVSKPANGKNVITVGASQNDRCGSYVPSQCEGPNIDGMACFSSQGPSQGRIKPDIVAPGTDVLSSGSTDPEATWGGWDQAWTGDLYALIPGTSMSAPMVTGAATLFYQSYMDRHGNMPSPALVKAALINTATDMGGGFPSNIQGWGRLNLRKAIEGPVEDGIAYFDQDEIDHLATGESWSTEMGVASSDEPLRITLTWTDPPGSAGCNPCHVNDLDLVVTAPDGTIYRGNQFDGAWSTADPDGRDEGNNVENVYIQSPMSGDWQVEISAVNVAVNPNLLEGQDFAVVGTGNFGGLSVEPVAADVCTADGSTDFTITLSNQFQGTTDLSASGLPAGTTAEFAPNPVIFPETQSVFTLGELGSATGGDYTLQFTATDAEDPGNTADTEAGLTLFGDVPAQTSLLTPSDGATDLGLQPEFTWETPDGAGEYQLQVATDSGFNDIVIDETITGTAFIPESPLPTGTDFFWRVRSVNACGEAVWSDVFMFQTRFEPVAEISPDSFEMEVIIGEQVSETLFIGNIGTGNLVWEVGTDAIESSVGSRDHDPGLDESFDLPEFTVEGDAEAPTPVEFTVDAGQLTRGDVIGFSFVGTASGVSDSSSWASDTCMVVEAPDGTTFGVGGFGSTGVIPGCGREHDWDFQGGGSSGDGTYESAHDGIYDPPLADEGEWTITFVNDWASASAGDITWSDVTVTLHKQPLPVCTDEVTDVPWLSVAPASGSTPAGETDEVTVTADATSLNQDVHEGYLCVTTNDTSDANLTLVPIPVELTVFDPNSGAIEGTVTGQGYCNASDPEPLADAQVTVEGQSNTFTTTTDSDGFYSININQDESPVDVTVSADGYLDTTETGVDITAGTTTTVDFEPLFDAPCASVEPESFSFELELGQSASEPLTLTNLDGNVDLEWEIATDTGPDDQSASGRSHDPALNETFELEEFTVVSPANGGDPQVFTVDAGVETSGDVVGFSFAGTASGITGENSLASDTCMIIEGPDGATFAVGGLSGSEPGCTDNFWDFQGGGSSDDGTYESMHDDAIEPAVDEGQWTITFVNDWDSEQAADITWSDAAVTLHKQEPALCAGVLTDVPWLSASATSGATPPGSSEDVDVIVDSSGLEHGVHEGHLCVDTNDPEVGLVTIPVELSAINPALGTLEGTVMAEDCAADPEPLAGALVTIEGQSNTFTTTTESDGTYSILIDEAESPVDITVSTDGYLNATEEGVVITGQQTTVADFGLTRDAACIETQPDELSATVGLGQTADRVVEIGNFGTQTLDWQIALPDEENVSGMLAEEWTSAGAPQDSEAMHVPTPAEEAAGIDSAPANAEPGASWVTGPIRQQLLQEGVVLIPQSTNNRIMAFDPESGDMIDPDFITYEEDLGTLQHVLPHPDGERLLVVSQSDVVHAFDLEGEYIGVFAPSGGADTSIMDNTRGMAFHPDTGNLLVTSASGDNSNAIVEFDLDGNYLGVFVESGAGGIDGPWSMQFRDSDLLVSASGNNIYSYGHDGSFIEVWNEDIDFTEQIIQIENGNILAAAFGSPSGVWELDPDGNQIDIYDPETLLRGVYELPDDNILTTNSGGVHEINRDGELVETKIDGSSHQISFVQTVDCGPPGWMSFDPLEGSVEPGGPVDTLTATFDPSGLAPGEYEGNFCIESNDPVRSSVQIPVTLTAELPADYATIEGTVQSRGYCNGEPEPLAGATVEIVGTGDTHVLETGDNGFYQTFLPDSESPLEITVTAPNHQSVSSSVSFTGGDVVVENFDLLLDEPCVTVAPESVSVEIDPDETRSGVLELGNVEGNDTLNWQIDTALPTDLQREPLAGDSSAGGSEAGVSLNSVLPQPFGSHGVVNPAQGVVDCENAPGLIVHDDGTVENGYSGNPDTVGEVAYADHFVPGSYPASFNSVCVAFVTQGPTSLDFEIVVYADDGPDGTPGTELGAMPVTAEGIPDDTGDPVWYSYDISSLDISIASGGVYIGVRYAPSAPNVYVASDESTGNPVGFAGGYWWNDSDNAWMPIESAFADYRAVFVRASQGAINCEDPVGVPWLSATPAFGILHAGETRDIQVDIDSSGLAPGEYSAGLCIFTDDPVNPVLTVPVDVTVRIPTDWATLEGTVESAGYCSADPGPLEGATVDITGAQGSYSVETGSDGFYQVSMPATESPASIDVSAPDHAGVSEADIAFAGGDVITRDYELILEAPCATTDPDAFTFELGAGATDNQTLNLGNVDGGAPLEWSVAEAPGIDSRAHFPDEPRFVEHVDDPDADAGPDPSQQDTVIDLFGPLPQGSEVPAYSTTGWTAPGYVALDASIPGTLTIVSENQPTNIYSATFIDNDFSQQYMLASADGDLPLHTFGMIDTETGEFSEQGTLTGDLADSWNSMKWDHGTGTLYAAGSETAGNALYTIDPTSLEATRVGPIEGDGMNPEAIVIAIAISPEGLMYGIDIIDDVLLAIDKETAEATVIGSLGFDANFAQDMDFDQSTGTLYWGGYFGSGDSQVLTVDTETGAATAIGNVQDGAELLSFSIAVPGGGCAAPEDVPWLSLAPSSGTTPAGETGEVAVTVDTTGLAMGEHEAFLCIDTNDPETGSISVPVTLTVTESPDEPDVDLSPASMSFELGAGTAGNDALLVGNTGTIALDWTLDEAEAGSCDTPTDIGWLSADTVEGTTAPGSDMTVEITADTAGLELGEYSAALCVNSNDPDKSVVEVPVTLTVTEPPAPEANLALTMVSIPYFVPMGETVNLQVMLTNLGPSPAEDVNVISAFDEDELSDITWECTAEDGAVCGATSGSGQLDELVTVPVDGVVFYSVQATMVDPGEDEQTISEIMAEPPADLTDPDPVMAYKEVVIRSGIFADRFESGSFRTIIPVPEEE